MTERREGPDLSVILASHGPYHVVADVLASLRDQSVADRVELVLATTDDSWLETIPEQATTGLAGVRYVTAGGAESPGALRAAAVHASASGVVVICEDHVAYDARWAEALIARHREPWAAVGPAFRSGNPDSLVGWADFVVSYGPWIEPVAEGRVTLLPGHNSSYKRERLLEYGDRLAGFLDAETTLFWDLDARGYGLYLEPAARVDHVNFSRLRVWLEVQYHAGRIFAAHRARHGRWSGARRAAYTLAAPLIPLVRLARCVGHVRRANAAPALVLAPVALGLIVDGVGQFLGYATGETGTSPEDFAWHEFDRVGINAGRAIR